MEIEWEPLDRDSKDVDSNENDFSNFWYCGCQNKCCDAQISLKVSKKLLRCRYAALKGSKVSHFTPHYPTLLKFISNYLKDRTQSVVIGNSNPLVFIGGPCAIESYDHTFLMAELISNICEKNNVPWIFKSCYDKDCRSAPESFHGIGLEEGLEILNRIRITLNI